MTRASLKQKSKANPRVEAHYATRWGIQYPVPHLGIFYLEVIMCAKSNSFIYLLLLAFIIAAFVIALTG